MTPLPQGHHSRTHQNTGLYRIPECKKGVSGAGEQYLTFSADTPERQVVARFVKRYGRQPERVFPANPGLIMAGPIPENANA